MASLTRVPQTSNDEKMTSSNPLSSAPAIDPSAASHPNPILFNSIDESTNQAPHLRTPLASEPADQWASSILSAVSQSDGQATSASTASTPGPNIPGAYPSTLPLPSKETVQEDVAALKNAAVSALETAKDYIVAGGQKLYPYINSAGQTAYSTTQEGATKAGEMAGAVPPAVGGAATSAGQTVSGGAVAAKDAAVSGATTASDTAASGAVAAKDTIVSGATTARDTTTSGAVAAKDTVVGSVSAVGERVSSGATGLGGTVCSIAEAAGDKLAPYLPSTVVSHIPHHVENDTSHITHSTAITDPTGNMNNGLEALDGTSFAKLPLEAKAGSAATQNTTSNPKNGLEGVSGTSLAKLPEERNAHVASTGVMDTGNAKNGLAGVAGTSLAKLPDERNASASGENVGFNAKYLNPVVVDAPGGASTHTPAKADADASVKTLPGSLLAGVGSKEHKTQREQEGDKHRGTFESKPLHEDHRRDKPDAHLETLREHDTPQKKKTSTIVESIKAKEDKYHKNVEGGLGHEPTVSKGPSDGHSAGTGANKKVNDTGREHAFGSADSALQQHGPPVPPKVDTTPHRGDSSAAQVGHSPTTTSPTKAVAIDNTSPGTAKDRAHGHSREGSQSSEGRKKAGFMSKMKGEMKVLSGKMTGKEEKVEEGRRIMGKN